MMGSPSNSTGSETKIPSRPDVTKQPKPGIASLLNHYSPPWVTDNLNKNSYKLLVRSWLAAWVSFLLMIPNRSLDKFGNAAFFACLATILIPPSFPVQVFFNAMAIMLLGSLFGWAWGCAAMKAALTVRDQVLLLSEIEIAQQTAGASANPDAIFNLQVFQGAFLDTRSSVVYGVFFAIGCFFFAICRAYSHRLALFSVFGTIFLDIICSYGPLFPAPNYTFLQSFITSTAASMAISCVIILLVFPETLNHQMLTGVSKLLVVLRQLIEVQETVLLAQDIEEIKLGSKVSVQIRALITGTYGSINKLTATAPMLSAEFSYGRFNGEDIRSLIEPLTILINRIVGLQSFVKLIGGVTLGPGNNPAASTTRSTTENSSTSNNPIHETNDHIMRHLHGPSDRQRNNVTHLQEDCSEEFLPLLYTTTADLRAASIEALRVAEVLITRVNTGRWWKPADAEPDLDEKLDKLRVALGEFKHTRRLEIIAPFKYLCSLPGNDRESTLRRRGLYYAFVFQANLVWVAEAIIVLLDSLGEIARKRPRARFWAPKSLRSLWKMFSTKTESDAAAFGEDIPPVDPVEVERAQMTQKRDPDSKPPSNVFQYTGAALYRCYTWCGTPKAIYAFKYTFISVALWLPSVFRTSAFTNYVNKGIWALIMSQTTLEPFMADQLYSYFARLTATTAGIFTGLVGWYIGAGNGNGNPFGVAAVMAVILVPIMFWRIFTPAIVPAIMAGTTALLVIGYSWIDAHLELLGNPGVGWPVAWRRWLLVLIGSGASGIIMFIPPRSAKTAVRLANASLIFELSQLYSSLISKWIVTEEEKSRGEKPSTQVYQISQWSGKFRADFTKVGERVQALKVRTGLARWEGSMRGAWPAEEYNELNELETEMLLYLAQLAGAVHHLDPEWRMRLLYRTKFLNPHFIADVMSVFSLVSRSLRTGEPLQETLPEDLVARLFYHHNRNGSSQNESESTADDHWEHMESPEYMAFAAGVTGVYKILSLLDRMHAVTVKLCGEVPLQGFSEWRETHSRQQ